MAIIERLSRITKREDVTKEYTVARCRNHGQAPKVENIYTGKKQNRFQGAVVVCPCDDECTVFSYDAKGAVDKWNALNFLFV